MVGERGKDSLASKMAEEVWLTSQQLGQAWQTLGAKGLAGLRGRMGSRDGEVCVGNGIGQEIRRGSSPLPSYRSPYAANVGEEALPDCGCRLVSLAVHSLSSDWEGSAPEL